MSAAEAYTRLYLFANWALCGYQRGDSVLRIRTRQGVKTYQLRSEVTKGLEGTFIARERRLLSQHP